MKFKNYIETESGIKDTSTSPGTAGQLLSSTVAGTSWIDQSDVVASGATRVLIACKNTSGGTITKGTPVYQTGNVGATDVIEIDEADALISAGHLPAIGLLETDLTNNAFGHVVITGELLNITTSPIDGVVPTTGDTIYLKSGGGLTLTKPTGEGNAIQNLGLVGKVSGGNSGSLTVASIMRQNDVPNLPTGRLFVGTAANTSKTSDVVYVDDTNDRVGIGTASPNSKLQVDGDAYIDETLNIETTISGSLTYGYGGVGAGNLVVGGLNFASFTPAVITLINQDTSINPGQDLGVLQFGGKDDQTNGYANGQIICTTAVGAGSGNTGGGIFRFLLSGNITGSSPTERMRITDTGNVGIGETTMSDKLSLKNGTENTAIRINSFNNTAGTESAIKFASVASSSLYAKGGIVFRNSSASFGRGDMHFLNDNAADSGNANTTDDTAMIIKQSGDVGIGTTSPQEKLHVNEAIPGNTLLEVENVRNNSTAGVKLTSASASYMAYTDAASDFAIFNNQTGKVNFKILDDGRVFIGVGNPTTLTEDVEIGGSVKATASTDAYKGYIKQTITSSANEKADNADYNLIPYNTLTTTSGNQSYNRMVAAYDGRIKKVYIRNTSGTVTADTVNFKKQVNNTTAATVYSATVANAGSAGMSAVYNFADNDFTFNEGDTFGILYQTVNSGGGARKMAGVAINIIVEYNIT